MCSQGVLLYEKVPRQQCTETSWEPVNAGEWKEVRGTCYRSRRPLQASETTLAFL